jgi:heme-degrading monooxygenase HmoA
MYARNVSIKLKPSMLNDFNKTFEQEVLPILRKQTGFKDEITFFVPDSNDVIAISLWDNKESAEAYNTASYPEVVKLLAKTFDGTPTVRTLEVIHSTVHSVAPISAAAAA